MLRRRQLRLLIGMVWLISTSVGYAQQAPKGPLVKLGQVSAADFESRPLPQDSTAEAVVLYEKAEVNFKLLNDQVWTMMRCHRRLKILKKSAYDRATVTLPTRRGSSGQSEFITDIEGYTFTLDNGNVTQTRLAKTGIFTERASDQIILQKFTLPGVREGAIIEYAYTQKTPFSVGHNPQPWTFQNDIPTGWSEYRIEVPSSLYYKIIMNGYLQLTVDETRSVPANLFDTDVNRNGTAYRLAVQDAPAFRNEPFITTPDDYISKVEFELASVSVPYQLRKDFTVTWPDLDKTLLNESIFGGQIKKAPFLREQAAAIRAQHPTDTLARLTAAYDLIRKTVKWDETSGIYSLNTRKVWENKKGDAGDINLLLIGFLRELDFEVDPVLLSTRSHGRIDQNYALLRRFNYVVAHVQLNGRSLLLDATDPHLLPGMLPVRCLNGTGRLVHESAGRFVSLRPTERDVDAYVAQLTIDAEGAISGTLTHSHSGYSALDARTRLATGGKEAFIKHVQQQKPVWQLTNTKFADEQAMKRTVDVSYELTVPEAVMTAGDRMYLRPMFTQGRTANPFQAQERQFPVDFGMASDETFVATYTLPDGYDVEELPKAATIVLPDKAGRFTYQVSASGRTISVMSRISLNEPIFWAGQYSTLREFFDRIVQKHGEQIVLKQTSLAQKK